jgi:transposase
MSRNGTVPRPYTDEFRVEAVRLGEWPEASHSIEGNLAAKRLGIPESSLWNWMRRSRLGKLAAVVPSVTAVKRSSSELEAEIDRLRRELANAKQDLKIVWPEASHKKAAAYFAKEERSEGCRGEICVDQRTQRFVSRCPIVPIATSLAQRLPAMAVSPTEQSCVGE